MTRVLMAINEHVLSFSGVKVVEPTYFSNHY